MFPTVESPPSGEPFTREEIAMRVLGLALVVVGLPLIGCSGTGSGYGGGGSPGQNSFVGGSAAGPGGSAVQDPRDAQILQELDALNERARKIDEAGNPGLVEEYRKLAQKYGLKTELHTVTHDDQAPAAAGGYRRVAKCGGVGSIYSETATEQCVVTHKSGSGCDIFCVEIPRRIK
jgi:hypothetical protein